jgi:hypothetical protein
MHSQCTTKPAIMWLVCHQQVSDDCCKLDRTQLQPCPKDRRLLLIKSQPAAEVQSPAYWLQPCSQKDKAAATLQTRCTTAAHKIGAGGCGAVPSKPLESVLNAASCSELAPSSPAICTHTSAKRSDAATCSRGSMQEQQQQQQQ